MGKPSQTGSGSGFGNQKLKGENFYHDRKKVAYLNMLKTGRPIRNKDGKIVKAAAFQNRNVDPVARILPNRKWFGNTRVISQTAMDDFRTKLSEKINDPYQVLMRTNKLPLSLLQSNDHDDVARTARILDTSSFNSTFGPKSSRKRPTLKVDSVSQLAQAVQDTHDEYVPEKDANLLSNRITDYVDETKDWYFGAGMSKRIWNELYKVIDSSDVVIHVLDARDPLGTRCIHVEKYLQKEAPHKHLIYVLNKVDLIPTWATSRWVKILSRERPTIAFHASINNSFGKGSLIQLLRQYSKLNSDKKQISVGFIGYPNTGKSSIINTLRKKKVCTVAPIPGETKVWQYITLMRRIYLIDCPGIVQSSSGDTETDVVLKGSIRTGNLQTPEDYIDEIINKRVKKEYIARTYNIDNWSDHIDFLTMLAKSTGKLNKGGEPNLHVCSIMVINDFLRGKLPHFVEPPSNNIEEIPLTNTNQFLVTQEIEKIQVLADYHQYDLKKPEKYVDDEPEADSIPDTNTDSPSENTAPSSKQKQEPKAPEPDWDALFENVVGETIPFVPQSSSSAAVAADQDAASDDAEQHEELAVDSELDSDIDSESDNKESAKGSRMTTNKNKRKENFYTQHNVKNKSSKASSKAISADNMVKKMRKPGAWKVSQKKK
ncbi:Nucleolar GTP-binding protein 2 [Smittium culicis]|uniref:Nucleolar GTP-binding protein 2 n=1 Tax=Smittium culicis TaxID=133412 RepID=A0A1R1XQM7_9FUNG|nr:Nucleolar GTP-binding protein 2 [Smittium culicis]OMJ14111.1 Nucleolar GTP-binding protein 2 [Smittium culicis]OMJ16889.1 Nucleolar GTP-binding protein 2 [Smittium culicis]